MDTLDQKKAKLDKKLDDSDLTAAVNTLLKDARRRKLQIIALAVSVAFDLILSVAILAIASQAENNKQAIIARCEQTNDQRQKGAQLWDYFIVQTENIPRTPDEQKFRDGFIQLKNDTYQLSDCTKAVK